MLDEGDLRDLGEGWVVKYVRGKAHRGERVGCGWRSVGSEVIMMALDAWT